MIIKLQKKEKPKALITSKVLETPNPNHLVAAHQAAPWIILMCNNKSQGMYLFLFVGRK